MIGMQSHKGELCVYSKVFCQEGYCSECEICNTSTLANHQGSLRQTPVFSREFVKVRNIELPVAH